MSSNKVREKECNDCINVFVVLEKLGVVYENEDEYMEYYTTIDLNQVGGGVLLLISFTYI